MTIEYAKHADQTEIVCVCKNTADADGFSQCLPDGTLVGNYESSTPSEHVVCFSCLRIILSASGLVTGVAKLDADGQLPCKHEDIWSVSGQSNDWCQSCGRSSVARVR